MIINIFNYTSSNVIFQFPDPSILSMKVRILEKIYHHTNSPTLSTPFCRQQEDHWIRNLGTTFPYGCNDNINKVHILTSPLTNNVNVMGLFPNNKRRRCSQGHRSYNRAIIHDVMLMSLLPYVNKPLGPHHIGTKLCSVPMRVLLTLFEQAKASPYLDFSTQAYRLNSLIMDVGHHKLFKPPHK
jgi:hypothetical protein